MAKISFGTGLENYIAQLRELGVQVEGVCKYALYDAAGMVADEIKAAAPEDTGDLKESLAISPYKNEDGFVYTKIDFVGYDRKGTPNSLKARAYESGTSRQPKRPFVRPTVQRVKAMAEAMIEKKFNEKCEEIMGKD